MQLVLYNVYIHTYFIIYIINIIYQLSRINII